MAFDAIHNRLSTEQAQFNRAQQGQDLRQMDEAISRVQELIHSARGLAVIPTLTVSKGRMIEDMTHTLATMQQTRDATVRQIAATTQLESISQPSFSTPEFLGTLIMMFMLLAFLFRPRARLAQPPGGAPLN